MMNLQTFAGALSLGILGLVLSTSGTYAMGADKHSDSLQALANLQQAKALLGNEPSAIAEINAAIAELEKSNPSLGKKKPVLAMPPNKMERNNRFREVLKLLAKAKQEIKDESDESLILKAKSERHVQKAYKIIDEQVRHLS